MNVPPPGDNIPSYPDPDVEFNRLGVRIPTILISPWVPKGLILSEPPDAQKPYGNSEYSLTSIIATTRILLGMTSGPLTKRDAWSATFEQVFNLTEPRTDCPYNLPAAPPPSVQYSPEKEAKMPLNGLQEDIMTLHANLLGEEFPTHITSQGQVAEWVQEKFRTHSEITQKWKQSKAQKWQSAATASNYDVVVAPGQTQWVSTDWAINQNISVPYVTLSILTNTLCLDYEITNLTVGVSLCYPSPYPATNRDPGQQWVWGQDAMVRPYAYPSLCLATSVLEGNPQAYLAKCNFDDISQHFAWQGGEIPAIGKGSGSIGFGPYSLGLVYPLLPHSYC